MAQSLRLRMFKIVCDELALSHFAMGFVLYFSTGKNFRDEVKRLFTLCGICGKGEKTKAARSSISFETTGTHIPHSSGMGSRRAKSAALSIPSTNDRVEDRTSVFRGSLPIFKKNRKRDNFPGLEQCGQRGQRQPSKLLLLPRSDAIGD